jgi:hypothetical protein
VGVPLVAVWAAEATAVVAALRVVELLRLVAAVRGGVTGSRDATVAKGRWMSAALPI